MFITFEGIEGSGKTTQIRMLSDFLSGKGYSVVVTREPGGTELGEAVRGILLDPANAGKIDPWTEVFLYLASRTQHLVEVILPARREGKVILCDRYEDATVAYQGKARGLGIETVRNVLRSSPVWIAPDLTILFDLPPEAGFRRMRAGGKELDRFEREEIDFHRRVREGYLEIARGEPGRVRVINAEETAERIHVTLFQMIVQFLERVSP